MAHAFTLNNNFGAAFKNPKVKIRVASNSTCTAQTGVSIYTLAELTEKAIERYWNTVPSSSLKLNSEGVSGSYSNIDSGRLCAPTDSQCVSDANNAAVPVISGVSGIVVSCNNDAVNFNGANVFAVSLPNNFSRKKITGSVILINDSSSIFSTLSEDDKIAVLAHEIGHAIGLGHTEENEALMYYRQVNQRRNLGQDDIDGVSYLYPKTFDGYGCGLFGTIDTDKKIPPALWQMGFAFALFLLIMKLIRRIRFNFKPARG